MESKTTIGCDITRADFVLFRNEALRLGVSQAALLRRWIEKRLEKLREREASNV